MRVLMVAPHPVYSPRGTPISVFNRCVALGALGHQVDLVTYPVGDDRPTAGLHYIRASVPGVRSVAVGPSLAKLVLNAALSVRALRQAVGDRGRYDVVHTHEEAGLLGPALARLTGAPHLYDMGNDWSDVLGNYGLGPANPCRRVAAALENSVIAHAQAVIAHFPLIAERVRSVADTPVETVCNLPIEPDPDPVAAAAIRRSWASEGSTVVLYAGTLEPYQGVDLLVDALARLAPSHPSAVLVVVGGRPAQVDQLRHRAAELGVAHQLRPVGQIPSALVPSCLLAADILVSPRERGRNTPLKIFSYLAAGRPIVATDIVSHTQVLDGRNAVLVPPTAEGLAEGIGALIDAGPGGGPMVDVPGAAVRSGLAGYVAGVARAYAHVGAGRVTSDSVSAAVARIRRELQPEGGDPAFAGLLDDLVHRHVAPPEPPIRSVTSAV